LDDPGMVFVTFEYDDDFDNVPPGEVTFRVTLKGNGTLLTNDYKGDFAGSIIQNNIQGLFALLNILDQFGYIELPNPFVEEDDGKVDG
jgi:hypothetical protein